MSCRYARRGDATGLADGLPRVHDRGAEPFRPIDPSLQTQLSFFGGVLRETLGYGERGVIENDVSGHSRSFFSM